MTVHMLAGMGYDSNIYLLAGDHPILVDTGSGGHTREVIEFLNRVTNRADVRTIVLTHRHYDHVGGAAALSTQLSAKVLIHHLDAQPVREGLIDETEATMFGQRLEPVAISELHGGEVLSTGQDSYEVIHTPGHTAGGISLFNRNDRSLICGDTLFVGGVGRWDLATGDHDMLIASIKKLKELKPMDLYPGHGPSTKGNAGKQIETALKYLGES